MNAARLDAAVSYDERGLVPVIAQHALTGEVLMLGWANSEALRRTAETGEMWFWSRSRTRLWRKGETSGNVLRVRSITLDCDGDAILARVLPAGPTCHTGERSCFADSPTLRALADVIEARRDARTGYTGRLLDDRNLRLKKLGEEATELAIACADLDITRMAEEAADLLYHALVACAAEDVYIDDVLAVLERRSVPVSTLTNG